MYTKSTIQQQLDINAKKQELLQVVENYYTNYVVENLYLDYNGSTISTDKMNGLRTFSRAFTEAKEAIEVMNESDILFMYNNEGQMNYRIITQ